MLVDFEPAGTFEYFMETDYGLAADGRKCNGWSTSAASGVPRSAADPGPQGRSLDDSQIASGEADPQAGTLQLTLGDDDDVIIITKQRKAPNGRDLESLLRPRRS